MSLHFRSIYNIYKWTVRLLCVLLLATFPSCQDDLLYEPEEEYLEGYANLNLSFTFTPMEVAQLGSRSSTTLIETIKDLSVLIYDTEGKLIPNGYFYLQKDTDFTVKSANALQNDGNGSSSTVTTCRAELNYTINISRGKYRIYAIANMGDMSKNSDYSEVIKNESTMRTIQLVWNSNDIGANCQMSGWFHKESKSPDPANTHTDADDKYPSSYSNDVTNVPLITVSQDLSLHAWLRRAVAKVTVAYDATGLNDNTWIYLRSVSIRNLPAQCSLVANNAVTPPDTKPGDNTPETDRSSDVVKGETYFYSGETPETYKGKENDYSNYSKWPILANGNPRFGVHARTYKEENGVAVVDEEPVALYSYENLQGDGKDKKQQMKDSDEYDLVYTYRDKNSVATFIEVDAYYISTAEGNEGAGPIKYRFMLGKDIVDNYDLERNFHYKLTLIFRGNANNIDWHIDYQQEEKPGIYAPDPFYVSYMNGTMMEYPIRVEGNITRDYIDVTIDRNDWRPWDEKTNSYPSDSEHWHWWHGFGPAMGEYVPSSVPEPDPDPSWRGCEGTAVWNGFLSLYNTVTRTSIFKNSTDYPADSGDWNKKDWYKIDGDYTYTKDCGYDAEEYPDRNVTVISDNTENTTLAQGETHHKDEGYRRYKVPLGLPDGTYTYDFCKRNDDGTYTGVDPDGNKAKYGTYRVVKKGNVYTFYIPLYTRPLILTTATSYTGNNPFYSYLRRARIVISAEINNVKETRRKTVYQVRRQINPTVIMRRHDNTNCFTVELTHREGEERDNEFIPFPSRGPWTASITPNSGWEIVGRSSGKTESTVKFTIRPTGEIGPHEIRCAKVEIWYHSHSCRHTIYLRQGYAPIDMETGRADDNILWHSFNLWWVDNNNGTLIPRETDCPIEDGSFFRRGNYNDAIDPINGNYSYDAISDFNKGAKYNSTGSKRNVSDAKNAYFWLSPINKRVNNKPVLKKWSEITKPASTNDAATFSTLQLYGVDVKPPSYENWMTFVENPKITIDYGIAYGDGASGVQTDPDNAFRHSYISKMPYDSNDPYHLDAFNIVGQDVGGAYGVRACCVINIDNNKVLVLPLGHAGYGHRANTPADQPGALRYAGRDVLFPAPLNVDFVKHRPLLYSIYTNYGAIYWNDGNNNAHRSWDINYTTFDFNTYGQNGGNDAMLMRFVQSKSNAPTATQPYWDYNGSVKAARPGF